MPRPTPTVTLNSVDITADTFQGATIRYGRRDVTDPYAPSVLSLTVLTSATSQAWTPGLSVSVTANYTGWVLPRTRFVGKVTDVTIGNIYTTVTAVSDGLGFLARTRLANWVVNPSGATPDVGSALAAIVAEVAPTPFSFGYSAGYVNLLSDIDVGTSSALAAMQTVTSWELSGHLYEGPAAVVYFDPYRTNKTATYSLTDPSIIGNKWESSVSMSGLANVCKVDYNVNQTTSFVDYGSAALYGVFQTARTMQVDNVADAQSGAAAMVTMLANPYYQVSGFEIDLANATTTQTENLLDSIVGTVIDTSALTTYLPGLPSLSVVEGYTETIGHKWWRLSLNLSDVYQTLAPQAWQDVTPTLAWSSVGATVTWKSLRTGTL